LGYDNATRVTEQKKVEGKNDLMTNAKVQTMSQSSSRAQQNCRTVIGAIHGDNTAIHPYLSTCYAGAERVIADADLLIHDVIRKVVSPTSHRTNEHREVVRLLKRRQVSGQPHGL
jgi:hypothetical protein